MQYIRRSIAFFFALQQLKLDLATISASNYNDIFQHLGKGDPGFQNLLTKVSRAKPLLLPFFNHKDNIVKLIVDVDNALVKHPLFKWTLTRSLLVSIQDIMKVTDRYVRTEWTQEMRVDELHFMFSLLSFVRYYKSSLTNRKLFSNFNLEFIDSEAFLILKEYKEDFGADTIYSFYSLAFSDLPAKGSKDKRGL